VTGGEVGARPAKAVDGKGAERDQLGNRGSLVHFIAPESAANRLQSVPAEMTTSFQLSPSGTTCLQ